MKTETRKISLVIMSLLWVLSACGPGSPTQSPTVTETARIPAAWTATPSIPTATSTSAATVIETPATDKLTEEQILQVVLASLADFPWRLEQVATRTTGGPIESLTEAQLSTRGYNKSTQTLGNESIVIESILVDSVAYLKITGSPAETYGLVSGEWTQVAADSPLAQFIDMSVIDPVKIAAIFASDFAAMPRQDETGILWFTHVGAETVNGVATRIYEARGETFTYRWWIGDDGRFYKSTVEISGATRTILMAYDPTIHVQAPIP